MAHKYLVSVAGNSMAILLPEMIDEAGVFRFLPQSVIQYQGEHERYGYDQNSGFNLRIYVSTGKPYYRASARYASIVVPRFADIIPDLPHLVYAAFRSFLLNKGLYPVHSCVIGSTMFIGQSGAGKTTLVLEALTQGLPVLSGDRSVVEFNKKGKLFLLAGTQELSVRESMPQPNLPLIAQRGNRNIYTSPDILQAANTPITKIVFFKIGTQSIEEEMHQPTKIHQLLPHFLDLEKQTCCITGVGIAYQGALSARVGTSLIKKLSSICASVFYKEGSVEEILQLAQE